MSASGHRTRVRSGGGIRPSVRHPAAAVWVRQARESRRSVPSQNNTNRRSAIDARTTRHPGYRVSTIKRKRIEEPFGWMKTVGGLRKTRHCGRRLVEWFLCYDRDRLQSGSYSQAYRNGMSLSGVTKMELKHVKLISGPEKNAQKRPADCNDAVSENEPSHRSPPIRGPFVRLQEISG
jgi:hypothetical protein